MASERAQHYGNHTQFTPAYHFFAMPLAAIYLIWAISRLLDHHDHDTAFDAVGAFALFVGVTVSRLMALRVQDRIIRFEERVRLTRILPADLQPQIARIRAKHLIAIRFASDEEVPELVRATIADPGISAKALKQRIRDWQPDFFRT